MMGGMMSNSAPLFIPTDLATTKGWWDTNDRASFLLGTPSAYTNSGGDLYAINNKAAGTADGQGQVPPRLYQSTDADAPQYDSTNKAVINAYSSGGVQGLNSTLNSNTITPNSHNASALPNSTTEGWIFLMLNIDYQLSNGYKSVFSYGSTASTGTRGIGINASGTGSTDLAYLTLFLDGNSLTASIQDSTNRRNSWVLVGARFSTTLLELWIDGVVFGTTSTTDPATGTTGVNMFRSLVGASTAGYMCGTVGSPIVTTAVTTDQRQLYEGYICHTHNKLANLPGGHPYKTNPPTS